MLTKAERFEILTLSVEAIRKSIGKIKNKIVSDACLKSVHALWIYHLFINPGGLTAAELATKSEIDRSLISREMSALKKGGFVVYQSSKGRHSYNSLITLTERGRLLAEDMVKAALEIQNEVGAAIDPEELAIFYSVLEKIKNNLENISQE